VKFFAKARDVVGRETLAVHLPPDATVAELRHAICRACPDLATLAGGLLVAVNAKYAGDATPLSAGDEVACFPPVSGG
jgi:molybdopterin converting factor subunit 1